MARNVEMRDRVGGVFNHADSLLYVKTHIAMVDGLLTNGKLSLGLLPDGLKTGLKYVATQGGAATTDALLTVLTNAAIAAGLDTASYPGSFIVASAAYTLTVSASHVVKGDDSTGEVAAGGTIALEVNDWLVYRGNFTSVHNWDIVNNSHGLATVSVMGLMSAADKAKLDGIAANANNYVPSAYTVRTITATGVEVIDTATSDATGHVTVLSKRTLPNASQSVPGVMTAADKTKLDGIATGANAYVHPTQTAVTIDLTDIETINILTFDTLGHPTVLSKQTIRTGTSAQTGVLQLASGTDLTSALSTVKAATPSGAKTVLDYYSGIKRYADLATANAASHADGAIALITVA